MRKLVVNSLTAFIVAVAFVACAQPASALDAELAKKCRDLAIKEHPMPVAGSTSTGAAKAQRDAYKACVARGGAPDQKSGETEKK